MVEPKGKLGLGVIVGWCYAGVTLVVRYARVPIILAFVSKSEYGVWALLTSIVGVAITLESILSHVVTREVAKLAVSRRPGAGQINPTLLRTINRLYCKVTGIIGLAFLGSSASLPYLVKEEMPLASVMVLWFGCAISTLLYLHSSQKLAILDGIQEVWVGKFAKTLYELIGFAMLVVMLFLFDLGILSLVGALVLQTVFYWLVNRLCLFWYLPFTADSQAHSALIDPKLSHLLSNSCRKLFGVHTGTALLYLVPFVLIPRFLDVSVLTDFSIMGHLIQLSNYFVLPLLHVWYPTLPSRLRAGEDLSNGLGYIIIGAVVVNTGILIGTETILRLWVGPGHFLGSSVLIIYVLVAICDVTQVSFRSVLVALDKLDKVTWFVWGGLAVNVVVSYSLAEEYGLSGILVGTLVVQALLVVVMNSRLGMTASSEQSAAVKILKCSWPVVAVLALAIGITIPQFGGNQSLFWPLRATVVIAAVGAAYLSLGRRGRVYLLAELRNVGGAIVGIARG